MTRGSQPRRQPLRFGEVQIPDQLFDAFQRGECVVFAGAGVSMGPPANFPDFRNLVKKVAGGKFEKGRGKDAPEKYLGDLQDRGIFVHQYVAHLLTDERSRPNRLHFDVCRFFLGKTLRIVTTNFDQHFTTAYRHVSGGGEPRIQSAPALPVGSDFEGIIHIHGSTNDPRHLVLTDRDFGRAYITEAWAARFLLEVYSRFTVLFIGYSHDDTIISYLARGFGGSGHPRYALTDKPASWNRLGIEAIPFQLAQSGNPYQHLPHAVERFADVICMDTIGKVRKTKAMLLQNPPELGTHDHDILKKSLEDHTVARNFAGLASGAQWGEWLEKAGIVDLLMDSDASAPMWLVQLTHWYCFKICCHHPDLPFTYLANRKKVPGDLFVARMWQALEWAKDFPAPIAGRWIVLLAIQYESAKFIISHAHLLQRMVDAEQFGAAHVLHAELIRPRFSMRTYVMPSDGGIRFSPEYAIRGDRSALQKFHQAHVLTNLEQWSAYLIAAIPVHFLSIEAASRAFTNQEQGYDSWTRLRHAIARDSQDERYPHDRDILIDSLRDACLWLLQVRPENGEALVDGWVDSHIAMLRRIAIFLLVHTQRRSADDMFELIDRKKLTVDVAVHPEIFALLKAHANNVSAPKIKVFLDKTRALYRERQASPENGDYRYFTLLSWLRKHAPVHGRILARRLRGLQQAGRKFGERDRPDLLHSWTMRSGTAEIVLRDPDEVARLPVLAICRDMLAMYGATDGLRSGPGPSLRALAAKHPRKALAVLQALVQRRKQSDNVRSMLSTILNGLVPAMENPHELEFTCVVIEAHINKQYPSMTASFLHEVIAKHLSVIPQRTRVRMLTLACRAARHVRGEAFLARSTNDDAYEAASFSTEGMLIPIALQLALDDRASPSKKNKLFSLLKYLFHGRDIVSRHAHMVALTYGAHLFHVNPSWTKKHLLELLIPVKGESNADYWRGFFQARNLTHEFLRQVDTKILASLGNILVDANRIVVHEFFQIVVTYCVVVRRERYAHTIANIILSSQEVDIRASFYNTFGSFTHEGTGQVSGDEIWNRWMKGNLSMRKWGRPVPFSREESTAVLTCVVQMRACFAAAVETLIQFPPPIDLHQMVLFEVHERAPWRDQPRAVARLLRWAYHGSDAVVWFDPDREAMFLHIARKANDPIVIRAMANALAECGYDRADQLLDLDEVVATTPTVLQESAPDASE